jgi:hypothetical protein
MRNDPADAVPLFQVPINRVTRTAQSKPGTTLTTLENFHAIAAAMGTLIRHLHPEL